MPNVR
jgi:hypothetical protein